MIQDTLLPHQSCRGSSEVNQTRGQQTVSSNLCLYNVSTSTRDCEGNDMSNRQQNSSRVHWEAAESDICKPGFSFTASRSFTGIKSLTTYMDLIARDILSCNNQENSHTRLAVVQRCLVGYPTGFSCNCLFPDVLNSRCAYILEEIPRQPQWKKITCRGRTLRGGEVISRMPTTRKGAEQLK